MAVCRWSGRICRGWHTVWHTVLLRPEALISASDRLAKRRWSLRGVPLRQRRVLRLRGRHGWSQLPLLSPRLERFWNSRFGVLRGGRCAVQATGRGGTCLGRAAGVHGAYWMLALALG